MIKFVIMSDLYIDFNYFFIFEMKMLINLFKKEKIDYFYIVGDIFNYFIKDIFFFINNLKKYIKFSYNLGNYDMFDLIEIEI